ncbi:MAG: hypothetical protein SA378_01125 [Sedimentibacter sp.]|uniref:hypothetical protein n=1 Tax=Sedimentibacter sp. TaxID=1960295 RepID=UPI0029823258|nr:hypothetical protein [Sedimentibacter sp.]MDW5298733.1 hypothetical protein [Sedimentibacter sp.]
MKNNRLTNFEIINLQDYVDRINELASLEFASFINSIEKNNEIKEIVKPYMMWFENEANKIQKIIDSNK